jgi:TorA maturation chaperone TorD
MPPTPAEEDLWRYQTWHLLAHAMAMPPDDDLLARLRALPTASVDDAPPLAKAWAELGAAARRFDAQSLAEEYQRLFIGPTRGELVPYGSWYQTGFLMEKPLALLREDLNRLGYRRLDTNKEPEDHVAALCETLCLLIEADDPRQGEFFARHLAPWLGRFFQDLQRASSAEFYRAVGALGEALFELERVSQVLP